jgi:transposase
MELRNAVRPADRPARARQRASQARGQDHRHRGGTVSAVAAGVGNFRRFEGGAQFGAWLGLVPSQNSGGGKLSLGRITKRGEDDLRMLLIQGAKSAVMSAHKRQGPTSRWLVQLKDRKAAAEGLHGLIADSCRSTCHPPIRTHPPR